MNQATARNWLPWALLGLTFGRHHFVDILAHFYANAMFARRALFYAAGGIVGAALYGLVWLLTPWQPAGVRIAVALACCWGIMEESQVAVCRIGLGLGQPAPETAMWHGICDKLSGVPVSTMMLVIPLIVVYTIASAKWGDHVRV